MHRFLVERDGADSTRMLSKSRSTPSPGVRTALPHFEKTPSTVAAKLTVHFPASIQQALHDTTSGRASDIFFCHTVVTQLAKRRDSGQTCGSNLEITATRRFDDNL